MIVACRTKRLANTLLVRLCFVLLGLAGLLGCAKQEGSSDAQSSSDGNLLASASITSVNGVRKPERLFDGRAAVEGDHWRTDLTTVLTGADSSIEFDLGRSMPLKAAYLQGDNNDRYMVATSTDGKTWANTWSASPTSRPGLRQRYSVRLRGAARYVRLTASGGDRSYAVSEFALYSEIPRVFPPKYPARAGVPLEEALRSQILTFGAALCLYVLAAFRRLRWWLLLLMSAAPIAAGYVLIDGIAELWPVGQREVSLLRATVAAIALVAVVREVFAPKRAAAEPRVVIAALGLSAGVALLSFYNLGHPQFWDHKYDKPSLVHNYDMRVYFPVAKYFDELGFDGLYLASVAAFFDDVPNASARNYGHVELRDLKTHRTRRVSEVAPEIEAVKRRFSPERWQEFKRDMRYFRETMGTNAYLSTLLDHGGNATPVWFTIASFMFSAADASNTTLLLSGMLDPLLLLVAFAAVGFTFGVRTMLVSAVVFGANDFYMFGSNWAGATLRHDWMAALALGACALRKERWMLGGALLAYSALIRAFPALALVSMTLPALWWVYEYRREHRRLPAARTMLAEHRPLFRAILGAGLFCVAAILLSSIVLGPDAWPAWLRKVQLLDRGAHVNHVSLRGLVGFDLDRSFHATLRARAPWLALATTLYVALIVVAARRRRLEYAAILGLFLVPVVFNPANYYIHLIFVFPLLAFERRRATPDTEPAVDYTGAFVWACLLAICVAQYQTVLDPRLDTHFLGATIILFTGLTAILAAIAFEQHRRGLLFGRSVAPAAAPTAPTQGPEVDTKPTDVSPPIESGQADETLTEAAEAPPETKDGELIRQ